MRVIGLTGGIASGKSAVAAIMAEAGIAIIDADILAREAVEPGSTGLQQIRHMFGDCVIAADGTLDRQTLSAIIFADNEARKKLEGILHPAIAKLAEARLAELRQSGTKAAIYMAALLIEAGVTDRVDEIWVVYTDRTTQIGRICTRDNLPKEAAEQRLAAQMPMEEKCRFGKVIIENCGTLDELKAKVLANLETEGLK